MIYSIMIEIVWRNRILGITLKTSKKKQARNCSSEATIRTHMSRNLSLKRRYDPIQDPIRTNNVNKKDEIKKKLIQMNRIWRLKFFIWIR